MPKFKIVYGLSGMDEDSQIIEADNLEEAENIAFEAAIESVNSWIRYRAEPVEDEES